MKRKIVVGMMSFLMAGMLAFGNYGEVQAEGSNFTFEKLYRLKDQAQNGASAPAESFRFQSTDSTPVNNQATLYAISCTKYNDTDNLDSIITYETLNDATKLALNNVKTLTLGTADYTEGEVKYTAASSNSVKKSVEITPPEARTYPSVGYYYYEFQETQGDTAGVTYSSDACVLRVAVVRDDATGALGIGNIKLMSVDATGKLAKKDSITNFYSAGTLTIEKQVTGNMGDRDKEFAVTVTFNAGEKKIKAPITITTETTTTTTNPTTLTPEAYGSSELTAIIYVKHGTKITFSNIPEGVTYTVKETKADGYDNPDYSLNGTAVSGDTVTGTVADTAEETMNPSVKIVNHKESSIDTGIILSNLPYILALLGIAAAASVLLVTKNHHRRED